MPRRGSPGLREEPSLSRSGHIVDISVFIAVNSLRHAVGLGSLRAESQWVGHLSPESFWMEKGSRNWGPQSRGSPRKARVSVIDRLEDAERKSVVILLHGIHYC